MKTIYIITLMLSSLAYSQNQTELQALLIEKEIIEKKIQILKLKMAKKQPINIEDEAFDFMMVEKLIEGEAKFIESLISENYIEKYQNLLENIKNSPHTKKLEQSIIARIDKLKVDMQNEVLNMNIGSSQN